MLKLYLVEIDQMDYCLHDVYVMATSENEAVEIAKSDIYFNENLEAEFTVYELKTDTKGIVARSFYAE